VRLPLVDSVAGGVRASVHMIDFGHVFPIVDGGLDDGYVFGLRKLVDCLCAALDRLGKQSPAAHAHAHAAAKPHAIASVDDESAAAHVPVINSDPRPDGALAKVRTDLARAPTQAA